MSDEDLKAELERPRAENEKLKARGARAVSMKVSEWDGRFTLTFVRGDRGDL